MIHVFVCPPTGNKLGSVELAYRPGQRGTESAYSADAVTAGAVTLMIQVALPLLTLDTTPGASCPPQTLTVLGGTNVSHSPPIDHVALVLLPLLAPMGLTASLEVVRRGFYPVGRGRAVLRVTPTTTLVQQLGYFLFIVLFDDILTQFCFFEISAPSP